MTRRKRPPSPRGSLHPLLDLHGHTGEEARRLAARWLRDRQAAGERTVVVVTGRGNRSAGPPVLRAEIEHLLAGLAGSLVEGFEPVQGGGGFQVTLRPPHAPAPSTDSAPLTGVDAELLRRAQEALWELGVAPTPALLRAEIRRLRRGG